MRPWAIGSIAFWNWLNVSKPGKKKDKVIHYKSIWFEILHCPRRSPITCVPKVRQPNDPCIFQCERDLTRIPDESSRFGFLCPHAQFCQCIWPSHLQSDLKFALDAQISSQTEKGLNDISFFLTSFLFCFSFLFSFFSLFPHFTPFIHNLPPYMGSCAATARLQSSFSMHSCVLGLRCLGIWKTPKRFHAWYRAATW